VLSRLRLLGESDLHGPEVGTEPFRTRFRPLQGDGLVPIDEPEELPRPSEEGRSLSRNRIGSLRSPSP